MGSRHRDWDVQCKVYVGNLGNNATKGDLESAFNKYGPLKNVWVARNPPGFAFIEYEDPRDAEDAVSHLDGTRMSGNRIKVEMSTGRSRGPGGGGGGRSGGGSYGGGNYGGGRRDFGRRRSHSRSPPPRRREYGNRSRSRSRSPRQGGRDRYSRSASPAPRDRRERSAST